MKAMSKFVLSLVFAIWFFSCSDDGPTPGCFQDGGRSIVSEIRNINGVIDFREACNFIIDPEEGLDENPTGFLFPCNLEEELKSDGLRVKFSGFIYESFKLEDICADFFELTDIEILEGSRHAIPTK